jgi:CHAT domain-containing protein
MTISRDEQDPIKLYLLGKLAGEEREAFERRLFKEEELIEELVAVENELIDDFLTGDLSTDEAAMFENNFLVTAERRRKLRRGKAFRRYAATASAVPAEPATAAPEGTAVPAPKRTRAAISWSWQQWFSSPLIQGAAVVALILLTVVGVWRVFFYQSDLEKGLIALNDAYRAQRPLEARISEFTYAPYPITRGDFNRVNPLELDYAERYLLDAERDDPGGNAYYALGKFYLAKRDFARALQLFEQALKSDSKKAEIYADLGAALLEKGKLEIERGQTDQRAESGQGMEYFAQSLTNLNRALELNNDLLEALFNRALLYEEMGPPAKAEEQWRAYLAKDSNSDWAEEARQKLRIIEQQHKKTSQTTEEIFKDFLRDYERGDEDRVWTTVSSLQNRPGNVVVEQVLDAYLTNVTHNETEEASRYLKLLRHLADLQIRRAGDRFVLDLARFYDSATPKQRELVASARELMKKGHAKWGHVTPAENQKLFENAWELFERAADFPEAAIARFWISFCHYRELDQVASQKILKPLLGMCENKEYVWLNIRGLYLLSAVEFDLNEHSKAVDFGQQSLQLAEVTNDSVGMLNAMTALIEYYRYLGNYSKALGCIQRSLPLVMNTALDSVQATRYYSWAALALATTGFHDAAAAYQGEALRLAFNIGSDAVKSQSYAFMGAINGKQKNFSEAIKNAQLAFEIAQSYSGDEAARNLQAYAALQMGNIHREAEDFEKANAYYTQSIALYSTFKDFKTYLYQAHKGKFFCYLRQHDDQKARQEIPIILDLLDKYRAKISDENNRNTFFDVEQSVFDALIDFEYSRMGNSEQAFNYSSSSRARSLLDLLNADKDVKAKIQDADIKFKAVSEPLTLREIEERLPEQTQILQYVILENKLLIWVISRNDSQVREIETTYKDLNETLRRYLDLISYPPTTTTTKNRFEELMLAKGLYRVLIQPVEGLLIKEKVLCIIPDRTLSYLPFATLVSPESGKYFFEEHFLMTSQSPSVFLTCSETAAKKAGARDETILSVGNPSFDRRAFPNLENLTAAAREAEEIKSLYRSGTSLVDAEAIKSAINKEIRRSDVLHLALHSQLDDNVPLRSKLLLASANTQAGDKLSESVLYAFEIYNLQLRRTRVVVLSSCQSGAERYYGGEGMMSLARAFIGAGAPLVVASLWRVDSAATEELMVGFHKHRTRGVSTVQALQNAQSEMLHGHVERFRHPYYWAGFTVTGGYSEF